jgi:hypothetical protein
LTAITRRSSSAGSSTGSPLISDVSPVSMVVEVVEVDV